MSGPNPLRKCRQLNEGPADELPSIELSLAALRVPPQEFECEDAALAAARANLACEEIADQLQHEAFLSTGKHRRDVLLAAVKGFDGVSFSIAQR